MRIVVTGATGFIGRELLSRLAADARYEPVAITRRSDAGLPGRVATVSAGDLASPSAEAALARAFDGAAAVVHLSALKLKTSGNEEAAFRANVRATEAVARAAVKAGAGRLVLVSSAHACGTATYEKPLDETSPTRPVDPYARSKIDSEAAVRGIAGPSATSWTIVRPPLVYGPGAQGTLALLARAVVRGVPLPLAFASTNRRDLVGVANLARFIEIAATDPRAANELFFVRDGETVSTRGLIETIARAAGRKPRLFARSPALVGRLVAMIGAGRVAERLVGNYEIDDSKARRLLAWSAPHPVAYDIGRMVEAIRSPAQAGVRASSS